MLVSNLPWVTHPCPSSLSLSSYARTWSSKPVLCAERVYHTCLSCQLSWNSSSNTSDIHQSLKLHIFPFFSHLLFVPNVSLGSEISGHTSLPAASRFWQDINNQTSLRVMSKNKTLDFLPLWNFLFFLILHHETSLTWTLVTLSWTDAVSSLHRQLRQRLQPNHHFKASTVN